MSATQEHNWYEVLDVPTTADDAAIRTAWRRQARATHTDTAGGDGSAFVLVTQAYEVLADPERRRQYDAMLEARDILRRLDEAARAEQAAAAQSGSDIAFPAAPVTQPATWTPTYTPTTPAAPSAAARARSRAGAFALGLGGWLVSGSFISWGVIVVVAVLGWVLAHTDFPANVWQLDGRQGMFVSEQLAWSGAWKTAAVWLVPGWLLSRVWRLRLLAPWITLPEVVFLLLAVLLGAPFMGVLFTSPGALELAAFAFGMWVVWVLALAGLGALVRLMSGAES